MGVIWDIVSILYALIYGHRQFLILGASGAIVLPLLVVLLVSIRTVTNIDGAVKNGRVSKTIFKVLQISCGEILDDSCGRSSGYC